MTKKKRKNKKTKNLIINGQSDEFCTRSRDFAEAIKVFILVDHVYSN